MDFQLDLLQKQAVEEALTKGVVVVTGGPEDLHWKDNNH